MPNSPKTESGLTRGAYEYEADALYVVLESMRVSESEKF